MSCLVTCFFYDMAVILTMQGIILPQELGCSVCESHGWWSEDIWGNITRLPNKFWDFKSCCIVRKSLTHFVKGLQQILKQWCLIVNSALNAIHLSVSFHVRSVSFWRGIVVKACFSCIKCILTASASKRDSQELIEPTAFKQISLFTPNVFKYLAYRL